MYLRENSQRDHEIMENIIIIILQSISLTLSRGSHTNLVAQDIELRDEGEELLAIYQKK